MDRPARVPDWQLPAGVDRALWEYLQSETIAEDYDEYFAQTRLLTLDRDFLRESFSKPGRLIDLGCGTGRLALDFAARGFDVVAVDLSKHMLEVTRRKRDQLGLSLEVLEGNICDLSSIESSSFDYAISMFSTLGMVVGIESRRRAMAEIHRLLKPEGLFGLHVHNRWFNLFDPQGRRWLWSDLARQAMGFSGAGTKCSHAIEESPISGFTFSPPANFAENFIELAFESFAGSRLPPTGRAASNSRALCLTFAPMVGWWWPRRISQINKSSLSKSYVKAKIICQ